MCPLQLAISSGVSYHHRDGPAGSVSHEHSTHIHVAILTGGVESVEPVHTALLSRAARQ